MDQATPSPPPPGYLNSVKVGWHGGIRGTCDAHHKKRTPQALNYVFSMFNFVMQTMDLLKQMLDTINVTYDERIFESEVGIANLQPEPFVSDYKTLISLIHVLFLSFGHTILRTCRIPPSEYTSLQPTLHMQDRCYVRLAPHIYSSPPLGVT